MLSRPITGLTMGFRRLWLPVMIGVLVCLIWSWIARSIIVLALRGEDLSLTCNLDGPLQAEAGEIVHVPFALRNLSSRTVSLRGYTVAGGCASYADFPNSLEAGQAADLELLVNTTGSYGRRTCEVMVLADTQRTPQVTAAFDLEVRADDLYRAQAIAPMREACPHELRTITITGFPGEKLSGISQPSDPNWKARIMRNERDIIELELSGTTPLLGPGVRQQAWESTIDVFFRATDLRRARIGLQSVIFSEWDFPAFISLNPLVRDRTDPSILVVHRSCEGVPDDSRVAILTPRGAPAYAVVEDQGLDSSHGSPERRFRIHVGTCELPSQKDALSLRLSGGTKEISIRIPFQVTGFDQGAR